MSVTPNANMVLNNVYNRLMRWNVEMTELEPELAESFSQPDDLTYVFKLRKGVRFHDVPPVNGRELTAEDIKYSVERAGGLHGIKAQFMSRSRFEGKLTSIETPDKSTVVFKTKEPYAPFLRYVSAVRIVPKEAVDKFKDLKNKAIGTGPFILKEQVRGSHFYLERNPKYFKEGLPYLDGIMIKFIRSLAATQSAFIAGQLDMTDVYYSQISTIKEQTPEATVVRRQGMNTWVLRVPPVTDTHPIKPPFDDVRVRRAISMAIDKQKLMKLALDGNGTVQVGSIPNWPKYSLGEEEQVEYNPEKARRLLADAGYPDGFSTPLLTWNQSYMTKPVQVIMQMLKAVNINVEMKSLEMAQYFNRIYKYDYDMSFHVMACSDDPDHGLTPTFGRNATYYKWKNEEIWRTIEQQQREMDPDKRASLIKDVQRKLIQDSPVTFLYTQSRFSVFQPHVFPKQVYFDPFMVYLFEGTWMIKK
jgi:peptide/nickel transport system substrate-binding protein